MGRRGRVVLRRIEDRVRRGICFRKRLAGLEKKAEELAVLCDAHVGFVVISCSDVDAHPHHFAAPATGFDTLVILVYWMVRKEWNNHIFNHDRKSWSQLIVAMTAGAKQWAPAPAGAKVLHLVAWNIENIVERYEHSLAAQKGVHGRRILEKSKSKDFQVPKETILDKGPINDDMRPIDETDISTLNMDQTIQIERLLEDELGWIRARKVVADRIARLQKKVQRKPATAETESNSTEMPSDHEKKQVGGGSQQSAEEEVEVVLSPSLSLGTGGRGDGGGGSAAEQRHRTPPAVDLNVPCRDAGQLQ
uniref:MADS-box domain-containing protein n=1 Tax=Oryza punctata TaxID=4537 RepID=A0A0E0KPT5_ORYPU